MFEREEKNAIIHRSLKLLLSIDPSKNLQTTKQKTYTTPPKKKTKNWPNQINKQKKNQTHPTKNLHNNVPLCPQTTTTCRSKESLNK